MEQNDIHMIVARVKNHLAREDIALSPNGGILVNTFSMMLKDLYDFADTLDNPQQEQLRNFLFLKETLPLYVIKLTMPPPKKEFGDGGRDTDCYDEYEGDEDECL